MKMTNLEKRFVNSAGHSAGVSRRAARLLTYAEPAPGNTYLDVGTGNGAAAIGMAQEYGLNVTGVDVDPAQIELARAAAGGATNVRFETLNGRALPFADGTFDIVSAFKVTHHIPNWQEAVAEMLRVIKVGGYFVYSDLVLPPWLAAAGARLVRFVGFPTAPGLDQIAGAQGFTRIYAARALLLYDAAYRKGTLTD